MLGLSLYVTPSGAIVTSLALKYLWVLQHPEAPTCLHPCIFTKVLKDVGMEVTKSIETRCIMWAKVGDDSMQQ